MADNVSKQRRSEIMSSIRSKNTKPEKIVREFLFKNNLRFRLHDNSLPGRPDIVLRKYGTLLFINGCFWHGHKDCKEYVMPKTNKAFWQEKIKANIARDKKEIRSLRRNGWHVYTIWGCELKPKKRLKTLQKLVNRILRNS